MNVMWVIDQWITLCSEGRCGSVEPKTTRRCELPAGHAGTLHYFDIGAWSSYQWIEEQ